VGYYFHSEGGYGHANEDAVQVRMYASEGSVLLCALADGMGGQAGGARAANQAVERSLLATDGYFREQLRDETTWVEIISGADSFLSDNDAAVYTTLVCLGIVDEFLAGASCGDSMALLLDGFGRQHILTESQRKNPPVGSGSALPVSFSARLGAGWQLVVMSDGVWKYLGWGEITEIVQEKRGFNVVFGLRELAQSRCKGRLWDDWSVVVLTDE